MMSARLLGLLVVPLVFAGCITPEQMMGAAIDAAGCLDVSAAQSRSAQFQYGGAVACKTADETHSWENPAPYASVQWGGTVLEGELTVRILDAADREVDSFTLGPETAASAAQGRSEPGFPSYPTAPWTVELTFTNFTGTMGLQVFAAMPPSADSGVGAEGAAAGLGDFRE